jgi:hypothetical protein
MAYTNRKSNWFAVTAGLLPVNFEESAKRLERDLLGIYPFARILNFNARDFLECAPLSLSKYGKYLKEDIPGYGYYCWKSEIVQRAISGEFGACDGVMWIDGGCEVFNVPWTRRELLREIQRAEQNGYVVFELDTPENRFSKSDVMSLFPRVDREDTSPQVQATHFFLHGEIGKKIADNWLKVGLNGIEVFDHSPSRMGDPADFVLHKSDQSTFSLTLKDMGLSQRISPPPAGNRGKLSRLGAMRAPVWVARNRTGKTIKGPIIKFIERLSK